MAVRLIRAVVHAIKRLKFRVGRMIDRGGAGPGGTTTEEKRSAYGLFLVAVKRRDYY